MDVNTEIHTWLLYCPYYGWALVEVNADKWSGSLAISRAIKHFMRVDRTGEVYNTKFGLKVDVFNAMCN